MKNYEKITKLTSNILGSTKDYIAEHGVMTGLGLALASATTVSFGSAVTAIYASSIESSGQQLGNIANFLANTLTTHAPSLNGLYSYSISPEAQMVGIGVAAIGIVGALVSKLMSNKEEISHKLASKLAEKFDIPIDDIKKGYNTNPSATKKFEAEAALAGGVSEFHLDKSSILNRIEKMQEKMQEKQAEKKHFKFI